MGPPSPLNLVLLGRTGRGKSATGNTIVGKEVFLSKRGASSVTQTCEAHSFTRPDGRVVNVIDTPGLFDPGASNAAVVAELSRVLGLCSVPPPDRQGGGTKKQKDGGGLSLLASAAGAPSSLLHGALIVLNGDDVRFTAEEQCALRLLRLLFGPRLLDVATFVFTRGDAFGSGEGSGCGGGAGDDDDAEAHFRDEVLRPLLRCESESGEGGAAGGAACSSEGGAARQGGHNEGGGGGGGGGGGEGEGARLLRGWLLAAGGRAVLVDNTAAGRRRRRPEQGQGQGPSGSNGGSSGGGSDVGGGGGGGPVRGCQVERLLRLVDANLDRLRAEKKAEEEEEEEEEAEAKEEAAAQAASAEAVGYGASDWAAHALTLTEAQRRSLEAPLSPAQQTDAARALSGQVGTLKAEVSGLRGLLEQMSKDQTATLMAVVRRLQTAEKEKEQGAHGQDADSADSADSAAAAADNISPQPPPSDLPPAPLAAI